eukprot:649450-Amphidinium_carterae.1
MFVTTQSNQVGFKGLKQEVLIERTKSVLWNGTYGSSKRLEEHILLEQSWKYSPNEVLHYSF